MKQLEKPRLVPASPRLMKEKEIAGWLGMSVSTFRRWRLAQIRKNDPLPVLVIDGGTWFSPFATEAFIQSHLVPDTLERSRSM